MFVFKTYTIFNGKIKFVRNFCFVLSSPFKIMTWLFVPFEIFDLNLGLPQIEKRVFIDDCGLTAPKKITQNCIELSQLKTRFQVFRQKKKKKIDKNKNNINQNNVLIISSISWCRSRSNVCIYDFTKTGQCPVLCVSFKWNVPTIKVSTEFQRSLSVSLKRQYLYFNSSYNDWVYWS